MDWERLKFDGGTVAMVGKMFINAVFMQSCGKCINSIHNLLLLHQMPSKIVLSLKYSVMVNVEQHITSCITDS